MKKNYQKPSLEQIAICPTTSMLTGSNQSFDIYENATVDTAADALGNMESDYSVW